MKFGLRTPSLKRRLAARSSFKRMVRHNLGFKAPRGMGWFTNPKKAAYNRIYNRTTVSFDKLFSNGRRRSSTQNRKNKSSGGQWLFWLIAAILVFKLPVNLIIFFVLLYLGYTQLGHFFKQDNTSSVQTDEQEKKVPVNNATVSPSYSDKKLSNCRALHVGATAAQVIESFGQPEAVEESMLTTKKRLTYKYFKFGDDYFTYYALRIAIDDGLVSEWDDKRSWALTKSK